MHERRSVALVDDDIRRRAAITHTLSHAGIHVEPFEDVMDICACWPRSGAILVADNGTAIRDLVTRMTQSGDWLPLVGFSDHPGTQRIVEAILDGALDYIEWPVEAGELMRVIAAVEHRGAAIGSLKLREARARSRIQRLTKREREVLAGVADGLSNRLIGAQLAISPRTVEIHRANMLTKIGATHTSEAIRIAIEASLVG